MRLSKITCLLLVGIFLGLTGCSQFKAYNITRLSYDPHGLGTLPNGLRVLIVPNDKMAKTLVTVRYQVGGAHAPEGKEGLPHLVEHLAFRVGDRFEKDSPQTTKQPPAQSDKKSSAIKELIVKKKSPAVIVTSLKQDNAWTNMDQTFYWKKTTPIHLEKTLAAYAEQMGDFTKKIGKGVLEVEREVVRNERRSSYEGKPLGRVNLDVYDQMYRAAHPYHGSNIGSHASIQSITMDDVSRFLSDHYHPSNAILTVMGPVDIAETYALVKKHFGSKPKKAPSVLKLPEFQLTEEEKVIEVKDAESTMLTVMWPLGKAETAIMRQLYLVHRSTGGWFNYKIKSRKELAESVSSWIQAGEHGSMYVVRAKIKDHDNTQRVKDQILDIADGLGRWVEKRWMARAKRRVIYETLYSLEDPISLATSLSQNIYEFGKPMAWVDYFQEIKGVDFKVARRATWDYLDESKARIMIHTPRPDLALNRRIEETTKNPEESTGGAPVDLSQNDKTNKKHTGKTDHDKRKLPRQVFRFTQPYNEHYQWAMNTVTVLDDVTQYTLDNGIRVLIRQDSNVLPIMAVTVAAHGGGSTQPEGLEGVSNYAINHMSLSSDEDSDISSRISSYDYEQNNTFNLRYTSKFPSMYASDGIRIVAERLEDPRYSWKSISSSLERSAKNIETKKDNIDTMSWRAFWRYRGLNALSKSATVESYKRISLGDIKDFHDEHFYPENITVSVVGNRKPEDIKPIIASTFGHWSKTGKPALSVKGLSNRVAAFKSGQLVSVPMKSAQTKLRLVFDAAGYDSDWESYQIQSGIKWLLQGRLRELRSLMGVTYGVHVSISEWNDFGNLMITSKVQRDATDASIKSLLKLLDNFKGTKITQGQLESIKRSKFNDRAAMGKDWASQDRAIRLANLSMKEIDMGIDKKTIEFWHGVTLEQFQAEVDKLFATTPTLIVTGAEIKNEAKREGHLSRFKDKLIQYTPDELIQ